MSRRRNRLQYFGALLWLRQRHFVRSAAFCIIAAAPALFWLWVNARFTGDPLAPLRHIDRDHAMLARMAVDSFGPLRARLQHLLYWPLAVCLVATPAFGLLGLWGSMRALWRHEPGWDLVALAWLPAAWFTFRAAILLDFRPMTRFTLVAASLSLVFAHDALARLGRRARAAAVAAAAATPLALAAACWNRTGAIAEWARPVAPIGSLPPGIAEAARWVKANARSDDVILLDGSTYYLDIPLAFVSGVPEDQWIRAAWKGDFEERLARRTPTLAVLVVRGSLGDYTRERFDFRRLEFCSAQRFTYATVYRTCAPGHIAR